MSPWKTISIFISSTFRDMHAERDQLYQVVFPALQERLKQRSCRLDPIDLRVGVETDSTKTERERELQILKVCLAEIERSRPFLLVLLGDRYGWVPGGDRIETAALEAGFGGLEPCTSVTALEIEYGLLKRDPGQRRRCLLCLREPMPYDRMPEEKTAIFSDAHATDPGAADRVRRLKVLKDKLRSNPELEQHRMPYRIGWDEQCNAPSEEDVTVWGAAVEEALWKMLDDETRQFAAQRAEPTWEDQERFTIEELVDRLAGNVVENGVVTRQAFVGRTPLLQQALSLARSSSTIDARRGLCFTGASGIGKSALFAQLHRDLSEEKDILLLSHACGVSARAAQATWMLRRWIGELGEAIGVTPVVSEDIKQDDLERLFTQWLERIASSRRVVLLVDALNQFSPIERARGISWLPTPWPENVRLIATAIPGLESEQLRHLPGMEVLAVPAFNDKEARAVAVQVYARFHRTPNPDVMRELFTLRSSDGALAAGNPLWLTIAVDLLNQLDADDFSAAESLTAGTGGQNLGRYVVARARSLPPDISGLYGELLARVEKVVGAAETRAFAALIALSRSGWREGDLQHLIPGAASLVAANQLDSSKTQFFEWDPLRFATLRRCFRSHLVKRGVLEQWDCAHSNFREAVRNLLATKWQATGKDLIKGIIACCADYLDSLPSDDPMRASETMVYLLSLGDRNRAANYLAGCRITTWSDRQGALAQATSVLAEAIQSAKDRDECDKLMDWISDLLHCGDANCTSDVAHAILYPLDEVLAITGTADAERARERLLNESLKALQQLVSTFPDDNIPGAVTSRRLGFPIGYQPTLREIQQQMAAAEANSRDFTRNLLALALSRTGHTHIVRGDAAAAHKAFREGHNIRKNDPWAGAFKVDRAYQMEIGNVLFAQGDLDGALAAFRVGEEFLGQFSCNFFSDELAQHTLFKDRIGDVLLTQGNVAGALQVYRESLAKRESVAASEAQKVMSITHDEPFPEADDIEGIQRYFQKDHSSVRSASAPSDEYWQQSIADSYKKVGTALQAGGDADGALDAYAKSAVIITRLASLDPTRARWNECLAELHGRTGELHLEYGNLHEALADYVKCLAIYERLVAINTSNSDWQDGVAACHDRIATVQKALSRNRVEQGANVNSLDLAMTHIKAGEPQLALDLLRPLLFPNDYPAMSQDRPLEMRIAFLHALMLAQNADALESNLHAIPEQDDSRIRAITDSLASWRRSFSFLQKLGFGRPPLPAPSLPPTAPSAASTSWL